MQLIRRRLQRFLWVALFSLGGLSVGPTVSRLALAPVDHCAPSTQGHAMASMDASTDASMHGANSSPLSREASEAPSSQAPAPEHAPPTLDHCSLCFIAAIALASAPEPLRLPAQGADAPSPIAERPSADRRSVWSPAIWRAPPAAS